MKKLYVITGSKEKAEQISKYIGIETERIDLDLDEIQSLDSHEVIKEKLNIAYKKVKKPLLVDDVSFQIKCLNDFPGPLIKWFIKALTLQGICNLVYKYPDKKASAVCMIGFHNGKNIQFFEGIVNGKISTKELGTNGFGWDKIFIPDGYNKTRAQMTDEDYDNTSPRKIAFNKFKEHYAK